MAFKHKLYQRNVKHTNVKHLTSLDLLSQFLPHGLQTTYPKKPNTKSSNLNHPNISDLTCFDFISQFLPNNI